MIPKQVRPIPNAGFFTAWVHEHGIDCLIRSADWYELPPIQRYLYNMAASDIRMEDAKTETRAYTFERFEHLRQLIERSTSQEWDAAFEAMMCWSTPEQRFGVVHLEQSNGNRGDIIIGDDPGHFLHFAPPKDEIVVIVHPFHASHGVEGSDA